MISKAELRTQLQTRRLRLSSAIVAEKSQAIAKQLLASDWSHIRSVHIYRTHSQWHEVDTSYIITAFQDNYPDLSIHTAPFSTEPPVATTRYDLIIVPVLGYDTSHNRLGMGAGWYDRFLADQLQAQTIGLAFRESKVDSLPREPHDQALSNVISA